MSIFVKENHKNKSVAERGRQLSDFRKLMD